MKNNGSVKSNISGKTGKVIFHHPKGNSLPVLLLQDLARHITMLGHDSNIRVLVLESKGSGAFCAGASFDELAEISSYEEGKDFFMGFSGVLNAMRKCPKLILVRVQGKTVGGGVGIAAAGDYTLAHTNADIKLSELTLGIGPFVIGPALRRKLGDAGFSTLAIDAGRWHSAEWAFQHGLYSRLFDSYKKLDAAVDELADQLANSNPEAMAELKKVFWKGTDHWDTLLEQRAEISGRLAVSDYTRRSIEEFRQEGE